jgi:hypothetical protein
MNIDKVWNEAIINPKEGFIKILESLSDSKIAKGLVKKMSESVTGASIEDFTIKPLKVEHSDYDQRHTRSSKAIVFTLVRYLSNDFELGQKKEYKLIIGDPSINEKAPHDLFPFSEYGYIKFGSEHQPDCTLWGEDDLSIWTNDIYKLEGEDDALIDQLLEFNCCLIENGNYQWVVMHNETNQLAIVTGLLDHIDFNESERQNNELHQVDMIPSLNLGEVYLRIMMANFYNISAREALKNDEYIQSI